MAAKKQIKVIFDVNIWLSFTIGKQLAILSNIILDSRFIVYTSNELIGEYLSILSKPKLQKYLTKDRINGTIRLMQNLTQVAIIKSAVSLSRDKKDDYLLALSQDNQVDYLITGDKDLLVLENYKDTKIITMTEFLKILE
jgi:uncharacterized protein